MTTGTSQRVLNWGFLSTARINRSLVPPLRVSKRNRLLAVASRTSERAQSYAKEWRIPRAYGSYEELLADPEIDVIYNPLPNDMHVEWTARAAQAGKHVLCEKPLALSVAEVDRMIAAARENNVYITEAFMYRHHPFTKQVRQMVTSGELGQPVLVRGSFSFTLTKPDDFRWLPAQGGGSIWDVGCYPISYSLMLAGEAPVEVEGWQVSSQSGIDLTFAGQMRFPSGLLAQFDSSFDLPYHTSMEIRGKEAALFIPSPFRPDRMESKPVLKRGDQETKLSVPKMDSYLAEVEDLAACILDGAAPVLPLEQSRLHIAVIIALLESARNGGVPVKL